MTYLLVSAVRGYRRAANKTPKSPLLNDVRFRNRLENLRPVLLHLGMALRNMTPPLFGQPD